MKSVKINPFLVEQEGIKTAGQRKYVVVNHFKDKVESKGFFRSYSYDSQMVSGLIDKDILKKLYGKEYQRNTLVVFLILLEKLNMDTDIVVLNSSQIVEKTGYKKSSINSAIKNLIELQVISKINGRGKTYHYYINPLLIFKGNNIDFIKAINSDLVKSVNTINKAF